MRCRLRRRRRESLYPPCSAGRSCIAQSFSFFVILSSILHASQRYLADRSILASFGRLVEEDPKAGATRELASILTDKFYTVAHTRAFRLLNAAIEAKAFGSRSPVDLAILSFDGFHFASRHFVRALLTFLPLLGFLGTVIGLAVAISELPHVATEGAGQALDMSASLAGLAVKFETTLLGLIGSMISSLSLNFLEKREAELSLNAATGLVARLSKQCRISSWRQEGRSIHRYRTGPYCWSFVVAHDPGRQNLL